MDSKLSALFGASFESGGRDISKGIDCQGLMIEAMKCYGITVPDTSTAVYATERVAKMIDSAAHSGQWEEVSIPEEGCVVAMAIDPESPGKVQHLGVYIGNGRFIHILKKRGVCVTKINDRFFFGKIKGYYKWKG